jgi:hypothetical protein
VSPVAHTGEKKNSVSEALAVGNLPVGEGRWWHLVGLCHPYVVMFYVLLLRTCLKRTVLTSGVGFGSYCVDR